MACIAFTGFYMVVWTGLVPSRFFFVWSSRFFLSCRQILNADWPHTTKPLWRLTNGPRDETVPSVFCSSLDSITSRFFFVTRFLFILFHFSLGLLDFFFFFDFLGAKINQRQRPQTRRRLSWRMRQRPPRNVDEGEIERTKNTAATTTTTTTATTATTTTTKTLWTEATTTAAVSFRAATTATTTTTTTATTTTTTTAKAAASAVAAIWGPAALGSSARGRCDRDRER